MMDKIIFSFLWLLLWLWDTPRRINRYLQGMSYTQYHRNDR